jgi:hypothetical protein
LRIRRAVFGGVVHFKVEYRRQISEPRQRSVFDKGFIEGRER